MKYDFNLEHPLYFTDSKYSKDVSKKYQVALPYNWHELMNNDEWVFQYPIGKFIERQGWKVHVSSEYKVAHIVLGIVAEICHSMKIPFKHLSTEDKFIIRNSKLISRGFSGKFITCYPNEDDLKLFLEKLEDELKAFNGPYILSDKRWKEAPIYIRYGVFRPSGVDEKNIAVDELIIGDTVIKDERLPQFKIPDGLKIPCFLEEWLSSNEGDKEQLPFVIENAIRFSNSGGIYNARLSENEKTIILKEARPYTGLGFDGIYSSERLDTEYKALGILKDYIEVPRVYWFGKVWEHTFLGIERMKGVPLNRWVTNNYPIYKVVDKEKQYLLRISKIIKKLIVLVETFHDKDVYHQDLHLGNVLIKDNDEVSIIDWEQAVFVNNEQNTHAIAAPGFRAWGETLPSEIDWYGIRQIAYYLFLPLVTTSDLTYNYVSQTRIEAIKQFEALGYPKEHIHKVEELLSCLDSKCPLINNVSTKKILKPFLEAPPLSDYNDIQLIVTKMLRGLTLCYRQWSEEFQFRNFPVHYYGLNINQGISFSDISILWSCYQLTKIVEGFKLDDYYEVKRKIMNDAVSAFGKSSFMGLFDGIAGTIWIMYELGDKEYAVELFCKYFEIMLEECESQNLYSGKAGIFLVAVYLLSKGKIDGILKQEILVKLKKFAIEYRENPGDFCKTGFGEIQSNDPYENHGGLFYGHAGLGWLFGEAYRYIGKDIYKECLELAIDMELSAYKYDDNGSLQYSQGYRLLPYLATGSAGMFILIKRNKEVLSEKYQDNLFALDKAINPVFCILPGLFNGYCGLEVSNYIYNNKSDTFKGQKKLIEGLYKYFSLIEEGLVLAGDNGSKITMDIASGFAGVAIALVSIMENKLALLPQV